MSADDETLGVYAVRAQDYASLVGNGGGRALTRFLSYLPPDARVLDLGCGPGHDAARIAAAGHMVEAVDACPEMVALAAAHPGVTARIATFDDIAGEGRHDGVWANFSLLHAPRADIPRHLAALHRTLKPGGVLHVGLKVGQGARRDTLGRFYTYFQPDEVDRLLQDAGFAPLARGHGTDPGLDGEMADWITVLSRKGSIGS